MGPWHPTRSPMGNAQKPTAQTCHFFPIWLVKRNFIHIESIDTLINIEDHLIKPLSWVLFHLHAKFLLGHVPPKYSPVYQHAITTCSERFVEYNVDRFIPESFTTPMTAQADGFTPHIMMTFKGTHGSLLLFYGMIRQSSTMLQIVGWGVSIYGDLR